jgi:hypothetical protein
MSSKDGEMGMKTGSREISMNRIFACLLLFACSVSCVYAEDFRVRAIGADIENGKLYLKLQVWNCSNKRTELPLADLPWGENAIGLVVFSAGQRGGQALPVVMPIADFPDTKVAIANMGFLQGRVDLSSRFPDLARYFARDGNFDGMVVFWEYDMSLIVGGNSRFVGGMIPVGSSNGSEKLAANACE